MLNASHYLASETLPNGRRECFDPPGLGLMRCTVVTSPVRMCFARTY